MAPFLENALEMNTCFFDQVEEQVEAIWQRNKHKVTKFYMTFYKMKLTNFR